MYVDNSYSNMAEKNWIQQAHERMQPLKIRYDPFLKNFILMHTELACVLSFVIFWWLAVIPP